MQWWQASLWGALGSALVEIADLHKSLRARGKLPWRGRNAASRNLYLLASLLRMVLGVGVAVTLGESGQVTGGFGAILAGVAAPKILESLQTQAAAPGRPAGELAAPPQPTERGEQDPSPANRAGRGRS